MTHGKNICNELKGIRRRIAEENGIPLEVEECTYAGPCRGTCPRCEAEVRYLENSLADRLRLGKAATVAGLALGLAASASAAEPIAAIPDFPSAPARVECLALKSDSVEVRGVLRDERTNDPVPFAIIAVMRGDDTVAQGRTDIDGHFAIRATPGKYDLRCSSLGYVSLWRRDVVVDATTEPLELLMDPAVMMGMAPVEVIQGKPAPDIIDPNAPTQQMEKDGVKVIVR